MDNIEPSRAPTDGYMPHFGEVVEDVFNKDRKKGWRRSSTQFLKSLSFGFMRKLTEIVWA